MHPKADDQATFEQMYKKKEQEFINMQEEVYNMDPRGLSSDSYIPLEQVLGAEFLENVETITIVPTVEEIEHQERLIEAFKCRPPFDIETAKKEFYDRTYSSTQYYSHILPSYISDQIENMELLALGYCSSNVYRMIKQFCVDNDKKVGDALQSYWNISNDEAIPKSIYRAVSLHDCKVIEIQKGNSGTYSLLIDNRGGFTTTTKITFIDAEVVLEEDGIVGASWIYEEVYVVDGGYEVHALLDRGNRVELIVRCSAIEKE